MPNDADIGAKLDNIAQYLKLLVGPQKKYNSGLQTLPFAVPYVPQDSDTNPTTGYTVVNVYTILGRKAPVIYLMNEGPGTIFARITSQSSISGFLSAEKPVFEGETAEFHDVWQLRLRTTTAGTEYRFSEFRQQMTRQRSFLKGRPFVDNRTLAAGGSVTELIVTDPVQGLGRNAHTGFIVDDGPGNLNVFLSSDGTIFTVQPIIVIPNQILDLEQEDIYTVIINSPTGASFRLAIH